MTVEQLVQTDGPFISVAAIETNVTKVVCIRHSGDELAVPLVRAALHAAVTDTNEVSSEDWAVRVVAKLDEQLKARASTLLVPTGMCIAFSIAKAGVNVAYAGEFQASLFRHGTQIERTRLHVHASDPRPDIAGLDSIVAASLPSRWIGGSCPLPPEHFRWNVQGGDVAVICSSEIAADAAVVQRIGSTTRLELVHQQGFVAMLSL